MAMTFDMVADIVTFQEDVNEYLQKKLPRFVLLWQRRIWKEVITKVVKRTPYRTGHARANWQVTKTVFSSRIFPVKVDTSPGGQDTIAQLHAIVDTYKAFDMVFIANNVRYIGFLEEGSSEQAPGGMVSLTIQEVRNKYENFVTEYDE